MIRRVSLDRLPWMIGRPPVPLASSGATPFDRLSSAGTWSMQFDGGDIGLNSFNEDVNAAFCTWAWQPTS